MEEKTYKQGAEDAWNAALRLVEMEWWERHEAMDSEVSTLWGMMKEFSAEAAIKRIRKYDESRNFAVGDEVKDANEKLAVVISVENGRLIVMNGAGHPYSLDSCMAKKTGRAYPELQFILKRVGGN